MCIYSYILRAGGLQTCGASDSRLGKPESTCPFGLKVLCS